MIYGTILIIAHLYDVESTISTVVKVTLNSPKWAREWHAFVWMAVWPAARVLTRN